MATTIILLAEDDLDDQFFFNAALDELGGDHKLVTVNDGRSVMKYLEKNQKPGVIVLDLNMPFLSGFEVLERLKNDAQYAQIPVFVLTTSNSPVDEDKCKRLGCVEFYTKPATIEAYVEIVKQIIPGGWRPNPLSQ